MRFARMCNEKGTKKGAARRQLPVIHRFAVLKANSAILCDLDIEVKQFLAGRAPRRKLSVTVLDDIGCRDRLSETIVHKHRMSERGEKLAAANQSSSSLPCSSYRRQNGAGISGVGSWNIAACISLPSFFTFTSMRGQIVSPAHSHLV